MFLSISFSSSLPAFVLFLYLLIALTSSLFEFVFIGSTPSVHPFSVQIPFLAGNFVFSVFFFFFIRFFLHLGRFPIYAVVCVCSLYVFLLLSIFPLTLAVSYPLYSQFSWNLLRSVFYVLVYMRFYYTLNAPSLRDLLFVFFFFFGCLDRFVP